MEQIAWVAILISELGIMGRSFGFISPFLFIFECPYMILIWRDDGTWNLLFSLLEQTTCFKTRDPNIIHTLVLLGADHENMGDAYTWAVPNKPCLYVPASDLGVKWAHIVGLG